MDLGQLPRNDWIRAATLAHMVLSQTASDELLDELVRASVSPVGALRAA
jgi:hypothetical protein